MKKKSSIIVIIVVSIVFLAILLLNLEGIIWDIQHPHDMSGYYYDIDDLREDIDRDNKKFSTPTYYENCEYLFSKDFGDIVVDFVIRDDQIAVVRINCREESGRKKFGLLSSASSSLDNVISKAESENDYNWRTILAGVLSPANLTQVHWCIVDKSSELFDEKYGSFAFEYNGEKRPLHEGNIYDNYIFYQTITRADIEE